jgi:hypothetical protein
VSFFTVISYTNTTIFSDFTTTRFVTDAYVEPTFTETDVVSVARTVTVLSNPPPVIVTSTFFQDATATVTSTPPGQTILRTQFIAGNVGTTVTQTETQTVFQTAAAPPDVISETITPTSTVFVYTTNSQSTAEIISAPNVATFVEFVQATRTAPYDKGYVFLSSSSHIRS